MTDLSRYGMALGFWDRSHLINNNFVASRCRQLTEFYKNSSYSQAPVLRDTDIDRLLIHASSLGYQWIFVQSHGHLALRRRFFDLIFEYIDNHNFFLMGHILDYKESYFELHHQCFLVNLNLFREFNFPRFGQPVDEPQELIATARSFENFHDDYTPYWVERDKDQRTEWKVPRHEGWGLISSSIANGYRVHNFTHEMRAFKTFLYPTAFTSNFEKALRDPTAVEALDLNICQKNFLRGMAYNWDAGKRSVFIFNTEDIGYSHRKISTDKSLDGLFAVASGFKPFKILADNHFYSGTKVIYFDYCQNALDFRRRMMAIWEGRNFVDFLKSHHDIFLYGHYQCIPRNDVSTVQGDPAFADIPRPEADFDRHLYLWNKTLDEFGGEKEFQSIWKAVQDLEHHYIHCDLIQDPFHLAPLLAGFRQQEVAWYWSNSFSVEATFTFLDEEKIQDGFENFRFLLESSKCRLHLYGTTPKGVDLQHHNNLFWGNCL